MVDPVAVPLATLLVKVGGTALKGASTANTLWSLHDKIKKLCETIKNDIPEEPKKQILVELTKAEKELARLQIELASELNVLKDALAINDGSLAVERARCSTLEQAHREELERNERAHLEELERNERAHDRALDRAKQDHLEEIDRGTCSLVQAHQKELARIKRVHLEQLESVKRAHLAELDEKRDGLFHRFRVRAANRPAVHTPHSSNMLPQDNEEVFA
jgi:ribosomal protein L11